MAAKLISRITLILVLSVAVMGLPSPAFTSRNIGESFDHFNGQFPPSNEAPFLILNKSAFPNWNEIQNQQEMRQSGNEVRRLSMPRPSREPVVLSLPDKRGERAILFDIFDFVVIEKPGSEGAVRAAAVVVPAKVPGKGVIGHSMRDSGK